MNEQKMLAEQIRLWTAEGRWCDRGWWKRAKNGTPEYRPTKREVAAKCRLFRSLSGWRGAAKRAPRGGEFAVATTAGSDAPVPTHVAHVATCCVLALLLAVLSGGQSVPRFRQPISACRKATVLRVNSCHLLPAEAQCAMPATCECRETSLTPGADAHGEPVP